MRVRLWNVWARIVTNLLRLQNTTFQTCSFSKYSPIIPRLIFKASLFSLSPPTTNPRTLSTRERGRERAQQRRWGERLNLAFREWSGRCLEIFHILFTAGRFQPGTAESWRVPLPGHSSSLSFLSVPGLLRLKISVSLQTFPHRLPLINTIKPKANTSALPPLPAAAGERQRGNQTPDKKNPFHAAGAQQPPFHFNIKVRV